MSPRQIVFRMPSMGNVVDGMGAQLHRAMSVAAFAKFIGASFEEFEFQQLMWRPADMADDEVSKAAIVNKMTKLLRALTREVAKPNPISTLNSCRIFTIRRADSFIYRILSTMPLDLLKVVFRILHFIARRNLIVEFEDAFFATNRYPDILNLLNYQELNLENDMNFTQGESHVNVAVHIRRGDVSPDSLNVELNQRFTPISYFYNVLVKIRKEFPNAKVRIYTDAPQKTTSFSPDEKQKSLWMQNLEMVDQITLVEQDFSSLLEVYENAEVCYQYNSWQSLTSLANADILIMSKSSFSYIGAVLNTSGLVIYQQFWHEPLSRWKIY